VVVVVVAAAAAAGGEAREGGRNGDSQEQLACLPVCLSVFVQHLGCRAACHDLA
jgi:hypothetical protein